MAALDTIAPTVTGFTIPAIGTTLTLQVSNLSATDNAAVTGYMLSESATVPTAVANGWSVTVPTSYTFTAPGSKTLYAWAKDAAENVSASKSALVTITLKTGDCDNSGTVTIAEVQSAINMFLGLKEVQACVDMNGDNAVSIAEVQKVINSFLGL